jgi:hypothetical protein
VVILCAANVPLAFALVRLAKRSAGQPAAVELQVLHDKKGLATSRAIPLQALYCREMLAARLQGNSFSLLSEAIEAGEK